MGDSTLQCKCVWKKEKSIPNYFLLSKPWLFYRTLEKQRVRHVSILTLTSGDQQKFTYLWIRYAHHTSASHMPRHVYYLRAANITRHDALVYKSKLKTHTRQSFYTLRTHSCHGQTADSRHTGAVCGCQHTFMYHNIWLARGTPMPNERGRGRPYWATHAKCKYKTVLNLYISASVPLSTTSVTTRNVTKLIKLFFNG